MKLKKLLNYLSLVFLSLLVPLSSFGGDYNYSKELGTMTVTAQKSSENIQDVPISITAFDEIDLEDRNIDSLEDIAQYTPNLTFLNFGGLGFLAPTMRGLYADPSSNSSTVGLYVDGVPTLTTFGFDVLVNDVERIEVLKRPQGTLYGKNAESGVINVISKKPGDSLKGRVSFENGEDNKRLYSIGLSGPVIQDKLRLGFSGRYYEKDGFIENTYHNRTSDDRENWFGRVYLNYEPTDNLEISLVSLKLNRNDGAGSMNNLNAEDLYEVPSDGNAYSRLTTFSNSLKLEYQIGDLNFTSVTCYKDDGEKRATDLDRTPIPEKQNHGSFDSTYETLSEEIKFTYSSQKIKYLFGLYGDKNESLVKNRKRRYLKPDNYNENETDDESIGVFAHVDYFMTDKLSILGGVRYDYDDKEFKIRNKDVALENSYSAFSPKLAVKYRLNENLMTYSTIAKGYKSGGFFLFAPVGKQKYDKETLINYEIGFKSTMLNKSLLVNGAVYYMDIDDMQVYTSLDGVYGYLSNAAKATSVGFELDASYSLSRGVKFYAGFGYNKTTYDTFEDAVDDYKDNEAPYTPEYNYTLGCQYRHADGFFARMDLNGYGEMYQDKMNESKKDAYSIVNAKVGFQMESVDLIMYAENLFDEEYHTEYAGHHLVLSDPREIGFRVNYRF